MNNVSKNTNKYLLINTVSIVPVLITADDKCIYRPAQ